MRRLPPSLTRPPTPMLPMSAPPPHALHPCPLILRVVEIDVCSDLRVLPSRRLRPRIRGLGHRDLACPRICHHLSLPPRYQHPLRETEAQHTATLLIHGVGRGQRRRVVGDDK
jgi:hypothetical protein